FHCWGESSGKTAVVYDQITRPFFAVSHIQYERVLENRNHRDQVTVRCPHGICGIENESTASWTNRVGVRIGRGRGETIGDEKLCEHDGHAECDNEKKRFAGKRHKTSLT